MPITTTVLTSLKRPFSAHEFIHTPAGRGLVPLPLRVALVGVQSAAATATVEEPVQVFDALDADTKFGRGSELALMCRQAFDQAQFQGSSPEIWAAPIAAPAGTSHATTITITGPATSDGNLKLRIAGRTIIVGVTNGDSATTIAAAVERAIAGLADVLPVTASVALGVVTATHVTAGENGGDVRYEIVDRPTGVTVAIASSATGSGAVDVTNALDALVDKDYDGIAIANHTALDITDAKTHTATQWGPIEKRWRWIIIGENGTLSTATTLAAASNDKTIILAAVEGSPSMPGEIAAAVAVRAFGTERPNANFDGAVLTLYPPPLSSAFTSAEQESALSAGATPLVPTPEGDRLQIVRLVTTKTTQDTAPFEELFDLAPSRTAAFMAKQYDAAYKSGFRQELLTTDPANANNVLKRLRDMVIEMQRSAESLGYIEGVDDLLGQIFAEKAGSPVGRVLVTAPIKVVSPLHQTVFVHTTYL